jgi:hypothetical protein
VATEIVRTLVGSIGLVASVPLTTWLAAYCFTLGESKQPKNGARVPAEATVKASVTDEERERTLAPEEHPIPDGWLGRLRRRS